MDAGKLNCQVALLQLVDAQDALGQPGQTWTTLATVWANIRHLSGLETIQGGAQTAVGVASIRIRWRTDVTTAMRVQHGTTLYEITAVLPDLQRRQHVDLACRVIT